MFMHEGVLIWVTTDVHEGALIRVSTDVHVDVLIWVTTDVHVGVLIWVSTYVHAGVLIWVLCIGGFIFMCMCGHLYSCLHLMRPLCPLRNKGLMCVTGH